MEIGRPKVREQGGGGGGWGWVGYLNSLTHEWVVGVVCDCLGVVAFDIVFWSQQLYVRFFVFFFGSIDSGIEILEGEWAKWRRGKAEEKESWEEEALLARENICFSKH